MGEFPKIEAETERDLTLSEDNFKWMRFMFTRLFVRKHFLHHMAPGV
jgi:hypothetical protein